MPGCFVTSSRMPGSTTRTGTSTCASSDAGALTGGLNWYRANTFAEPIGPITVPTLYVWSDDDVAIGREAAEGTAAHVDGPYRFEVLAGVSHWIPEAAPDRLNSLLLEHLRTG